MTERARQARLAKNLRKAAVERRVASSGTVDDQRFGAALRAVRHRRGLRQEDVGRLAGVHRSTISRLERGHFHALSWRAITAVGAALDVRVELLPRYRGGELDRLLNARHSALHESVARFLVRWPGWEAVPEVSFSIYGERGVIDILAYHATGRAVLVIELKTVIVDVQELVGTFDRKRRLALRIARERGWDARIVGGWVIVEGTRTNRRRIVGHRQMLRSAFPADGRVIRAWLAEPSAGVSGLSTWPVTVTRGAARGRQRIAAQRLPATRGA